MCEKEFQVEIIEAKRTQKVRQSVRPSGRFVNGNNQTDDVLLYLPFFKTGGMCDRISGTYLQDAGKIYN